MTLQHLFKSCISQNLGLFVIQSYPDLKIVYMLSSSRRLFCNSFRTEISLKTLRRWSKCLLHMFDGISNAKRNPFLIINERADFFIINIISKWMIPRLARIMNVHYHSACSRSLDDISGIILVAKLNMWHLQSAEAHCSSETMRPIRQQFSLPKSCSFRFRRVFFGDAFIKHFGD